MLPADITGFVSTAITSISDVLDGSIPLVLGVFALLVGLGLAIKYVRKWIGRKA